MNILILLRSINTRRERLLYYTCAALKIGDFLRQGNILNALNYICSFLFSNEFSSVFKNCEGGNLAASKIRNLECPSYEICLIDYGCGKFNRKIHIMEQYP